jgi:hypothetical protein
LHANKKILQTHFYSTKHNTLTRKIYSIQIFLVLPDLEIFAFNSGDRTTPPALLIKHKLTRNTSLFVLKIPIPPGAFKPLVAAPVFALTAPRLLPVKSKFILRRN